MLLYVMWFDVVCIWMLMLTKPLQDITSTVSARQGSLEAVDVDGIYDCRDNFIPVHGSLFDDNFENKSKSILT